MRRVPENRQKWCFMKPINILWGVFALCLTSACVSTGLKQYTLRIIDAETNAPVTGATLDLYYYPSAPEAPDPNHPRTSANAQGEFAVQVSGEPVIWQVRAADYIEQRFSSIKGGIPTRYAAQTTRGYGGVIHLYRLPEPRLVILVSDTYTGPLTINLQPAPGFGYVALDTVQVSFAATEPDASYIQETASQRVFTATFSAAGGVNLVVTPLLYDIQARHLQIRGSAGLLPYRDIADPPDEQRAVWGNITEDDKRLYHQIRLFIGTRKEYLGWLKTSSAVVH